MKIKWIELENIETGLSVERVDFFDDITLLVGLSGVGKTVILKAIEYSLILAHNKDAVLKPFKVTLGFEIDQDEYVWRYEIEKQVVKGVMVDEKPKYQFTYEKLTKNGETIFKRDETSIVILGYDKVPQPKRDESIISQYAEDSLFSEIVSEIDKVYSVDTDLQVRGGISVDGFNTFKEVVAEEINKGIGLDFDIFSHLPVPFKLYIAKKYYPELYAQIFSAVKEMFMEIEDISIVRHNYSEVVLVAINVYGKTLLQDAISNGMLKTIYYLVELYTMPKDSIVLIDEFENGLGVNCIDILSDLMLTERTDLQYIITSHHPKIINNVDADHWKIIDRNGSQVINSDSTSYGIGNSLHDAYFNLINRWEYEGKI